MMSGKSIHKIWWLWLPVLLMIIQIFLEILLPSSVLSVMHSENGPHELLQFFIIFFAFLLAVFFLFQIPMKEKPWLALWVGIAAVCSLYVAGEEISWGQHFLDWSTSDFWREINDQNETNLHNTSSWLDQKPRIMLELGVVVGGLIIPAIMHFKPTLLPTRFAVIYPSVHLSVVAGIFLLLKIIDKADVLHLNMFERISEVQEIYLFYFVLLYLIMLRQNS